MTRSIRNHLFFWPLAIVMALVLTPGELWAQLPFLNKAPTLTDGARLVQTIPWTDYLGPLAPVALSPFFGVTLLSGSAILAANDVMPATPLTTNAEILQEPVVFGVFLALTVMTSAPRLTKVTKPFAQAMDQLESYAGIVTVFLIQAAATLAANQAEATAGVLAEPLRGGFLDGGIAGALMLLSVINLFVINTVKFVFETLIWLSPIPLVDAFFEAALKAVTAGLMAIYIYSPGLAALIDLALFALSLLVFRWAFRLMGYGRSILFAPLAHGLLKRIGLSKDPSIDIARGPGAVRAAYPDAKAVLPVHLSKKQKKFPKRARAYLVRLKDGGAVMVRKPLTGALVVLGDEVPLKTLHAKRGWLAHTVSNGIDKDAPFRAQFSKRYSALWSELEKGFGWKEIEKDTRVAENLRGKELAAALRASQGNMNPLNE